MKISEIKNERLGESVFCGEHPSGLKVFVLPKKDYESAFALYGVKYGSIDTSIMNENGEYEAIPEGTAHFLEHKLFSQETSDKQAELFLRLTFHYMFYLFL